MVFVVVLLLLLVKKGAQDNRHRGRFRSTKDVARFLCEKGGYVASMLS